jgi:hypothetical protein
MKIKKNGKIITLSESDLKKIYNKVMNEQVQGPNSFEKCCKDQGISAPDSCKKGDLKICVQELGKMVTLENAMKMAEAIKCVSDSANNPVKN